MKLSGSAGLRRQAGLRCDPEGVARLLLERGADPDAAAADGTTAFQLCDRQAAEHECARSCGSLVRYGPLAGGD